METSFEHAKFEEALGYVSAVLAILKSMPHEPWSGYFDRLATALNARDVEASVRARDALPYAGMVGFADFLEAKPQIAQHYRAITRIIGVLKVHSRYGVPHS